MRSPGIGEPERTTSHGATETRISHAFMVICSIAWQPVATAEEACRRCLFGVSERSALALMIRD